MERRADAWRENRRELGGGPEFGTIFFGEILITASERRLSMIRLQLGSPEGGSEVYVEVDDERCLVNLIARAFT